MNTQELFNTILMTSVFVLVLSTWSICVVLWFIQYVRRQRQVRKRLGIGDADTQRSQALQLWREEYKDRSETDRAEKKTLFSRLEKLRADAGWKTSGAYGLSRRAGRGVSGRGGGGHDGYGYVGRPGRRRPW